MKIRFSPAALFLVLTAGTAFGVPTMNLNPADGSVSGHIGDYVGWNFTLTPESGTWVSVTSSVLSNESNASVGDYHDYIGAVGGASNFATGPGVTWTMTFDPSGHLGFHILSTGNDSADLVITYDLYSADPATCSCDPSQSHQQLSASVSIDGLEESPATGVPEPASLGLASVGAALVGVAARRRRRRVH